MGLLEVSRHDVLGKLVWLVDTESFTVWLPRDNVFVSIGDNVLEDNVKFERKWKLNLNKDEELESDFWFNAVNMPMGPGLLSWCFLLVSLYSYLGVVKTVLMG